MYWGTGDIKTWLHGQWQRLDVGVKVSAEGKAINEVLKSKFLGIVIGKKLGWQYHI